MSEDDVQLLRDARRRAARTLDDLLRHQAELDASVNRMDPTSLEAGQQAMSKAIDAARQLVQSLDQSLQQLGGQADK